LSKIPSFPKEKKLYNSDPSSTTHGTVVGPAADPPALPLILIRNDGGSWGSKSRSLPHTSYALHHKEVKNRIIYPHRGTHKKKKKSVFY